MRPGRPVPAPSTVLKHSAFMAAIQADPDTWLGPDGFILGDSGASDGDKLFLNPYHQPTEPDKCNFNFCHSSTRFFVEQTFGIWKSRFRFLLTYMRGANHKLYAQLIFASAILHNYLIVHSDDIIKPDTNEPHWERFFAEFKNMRCPDCVRKRASHCVHQAQFRNSVASVIRGRTLPSDLREEMCKELWARDTLCPGDEWLRQQMGERAMHGLSPDV